MKKFLFYLMRIRAGNIIYVISIKFLFKNKCLRIPILIYRITTKNDILKIVSQ